MRNKLLSIITPEQLIQDFHELKSVANIALKYKISTVTVYSALKIINFNCLVNQNNFKLSKDLLEETYNRLGSLRAVGRELNVHADSVRRYMKKYNLSYKNYIYFSDHEFFSKDTEESFYVAGFLAADGCIKNGKFKSGKSRSEVYLSLSMKDKDHLIKIKNILKSNVPIKDFLVKNSKYNVKWNDTWKSEFSITSKQMVEDLKRFNVVPRKSLIYSFPEWAIDHPLCNHFIRGYNDGDGSFYKHNGLHFSMRGTPNFLKTIRSILEEKCDLEKQTKDIRISSKHGILEYSSTKLLKIVNYLYKDATIYLARKKDICKLS